MTAANRLDDTNLIAGVAREARMPNGVYIASADPLAEATAVKFPDKFQNMASGPSDPLRTSSSMPLLDCPAQHDSAVS